MDKKIKIYIAGGFEDRKIIRGWMDILEKNGFEISSDWTTHTPIEPYEEHQKLAAQYVLEDFEGVKNCDVLILKSDTAGGGAHSEYGAAIVLGKKVFLIGRNKNKSMFYFHPKVERCGLFEEILNKLQEIY